MDYRLYDRAYVSDARSGTQINSLDMGTLLYEDIFHGAFVIVNDSNTKHQYFMTPSGSNVTISGNLTLAIDDYSNNSYSEFIDFYLDARLSKTIYFKYRVENAPILGSGNIFIGIKEV